MQSEQDEYTDQRDDDYAEWAKCRACGEFVAPEEIDRAGCCAGCSNW